MRAGFAATTGPGGGGDDDRGAGGFAGVAPVVGVPVAGAVAVVGEIGDARSGCAPLDSVRRVVGVAGQSAEAVAVAVVAAASTW